MKEYYQKIYDTLQSDLDKMLGELDEKGEPIKRSPKLIKETLSLMEDCWHKTYSQGSSEEDMVGLDLLAKLSPSAQAKIQDIIDEDLSEN